MKILVGDARFIGESNANIRLEMPLRSAITKDAFW